ncbi:transglycosylase SLT domain-containing protein [Cochlodiniinecator piscidefendens]|uniref:transglycosylase SLT domain-containing protein n=1 Tax=Cochlodiniinecator piscidefendens TaxID=2715756 RepID=UPI001E608FBA|nr:transglycosylase SLT domain-containing protein [Cochlodiniinecator piscidefendens]
MTRIVPKFMTRYGKQLIFVCCVFIHTTVSAAVINPSVSAICNQAAIQVSRESGVPLSVLRAISLTETGRRSQGEMHPWPWTVNMEGTGRWFQSPDEALSYVMENYGRGARSFDVGCFQINYRWHGENFASIEEMFDPIANTRYAAQFLTSLYNEMGDWSIAAGAYHSRTPQYAQRYRARFDQLRAQLTEDAPEIPDIVTSSYNATTPQTPPPNIPQPVRQNGFRLLQGEANSGRGSLVPTTAMRTVTPFIGN